MISITFVLLAFAICAVWLPPIQINKRFVLPPWAAFFVVSMVSGMVAGVLRPLGIVEIGLFCSVAYLTQATKQKPTQSFVFGSVTAILAVALAMHKLPGFNNPVVISSMALSAGATAFTQYAISTKVQLAWSFWHSYAAAQTHLQNGGSY